MMYVPEKGVANFVINQGIKVVKNTCPVDGSCLLYTSFLIAWYSLIQSQLLYRALQGGLY